MGFIRFWAAATILIVVGFGLASAGDTPIIQARVFFETKAQWVQLRDMGLDQVWIGDKYMEIATDQAELDKISALGFKSDIIHSDLSAYFRSRLPDKAMGAYKTLAEINQYLDNIITAYPEIVSQKVSIGKSIEDRDIWAVKISDNPNIDEDEPEVLYTAAIHCREVITPEVLFYFMDYLTQNYGSDPEVTDLVDNRELWFIVLINPDGYYYNEVTDPGGGGMWRKNRRDNGDGSYGVDLNRNFGYMWGYDDLGSSPQPDGETYRGTGPFSEPETQHLRDFTIAHDFVLTIYYHSYSNLILWSWGYEQIYNPDNDIFAALGDSAAAMNLYNPGPGWILYVVNGGSEDWNYGEQTLKDKNFSVVVEVGSYDDNFWPPANRIDDLVSENLGPNLFFARVAGDIYALRTPAAPTIAVDDTVSTGSYTVAWNHDDTLNPAVTYELMEMTGYQLIIDPAQDFEGWENREFTISADRYNSLPASFYSGEANSAARYIQTVDQYPVQPGDTLRFQAFYDIEANWDYAYVEVSSDGINYMPIEGNITTVTDPNGTNRGYGITGYSSGWIEGRFDLGDFVGQSIRIRFSYYTDRYVTGEGIYIDDIYPRVDFDSRMVYSSITDTSYIIMDQIEGDYYYKVRAIDAQNQAGLYSEIVKTYASDIYQCGDANGDGEINVADAVYMINYVFKSGPAPEPERAGDANGDGDTNIADGVYIINYVFKGGPEPICP